MLFEEIRSNVINLNSYLIFVHKKKKEEENMEFKYVVALNSMTKMIKQNFSRNA